MKLHTTILSAAFAIAASAGLATAQCSTQTLVPSGLVADDSYGEAVAAKGNFVVVGTPNDTNARGTHAGIVYIHMKTGSTWSNSPQVILPADTSTDSAFGQSVAIDSFVVVGANNGPFSGTAGTGAVYVYSNSGGTWSLQKKITSPDAAVGDMFGYSVATMGDWLAIGAIQDDTGGHTNNGAVYIYKRSGIDWLLQSKLAISSDEGGRVGTSLSMNNGYLAIGTSEDVSGVGAAGTVYVYRLVGNVWQFNDYIGPPLPQDNGRFGASLCLNGNTLAIGAYLSDLPGTQTDPDGVVYMYNLVNGHFTSPQQLPGYFFTGYKVAVNGDTAVATDIIWAGRNKMHLYRRSGGTWAETGSWYENNGNNGFTEADVAMTDTEIVLGLGAMDGAAGNNSGQVQIIPTQVVIAPDDFVSRAPIGVGSISACTTLATQDGSTSCGNSGTSPDVWYEFMPMNTARYSFDTIGSDFDTVLSLHPSSLGMQNTSIDCNDDFNPPNRASRIVHNGVAGTPLVVRVSGYNGASGLFTLNIHELCAADFNADGVVDFFDYLDFVDAFSSSAPEADFNQDHVIDFFDYLDYVDAFSSGC